MTGVRCCHAISHHYCSRQRMITGWSLRDRCSHLHAGALHYTRIITSLSPQNTVRSKERGAKALSTLLKHFEVQNYVTPRKQVMMAMSPFPILLVPDRDTLMFLAAHQFAGPNNLLHFSIVLYLVSFPAWWQHQPLNLTPRLKH